MQWPARGSVSRAAVSARYPLPAGKRWGGKRSGNSGRAVSSSGMPGSPHEPRCAYLGKLVLRPCRTGRACSGKLWCVPLALHRQLGDAVGISQVMPAEPGRSGACPKWSRLTSPRPKAASSDCALRAKCFRKLQFRKLRPSRAHLLRNVEVQRLHPVPRWGGLGSLRLRTPRRTGRKSALSGRRAEAVVNLTTTAARCRTSSKTGASRPPGCDLAEG